MKLRSCLFAIIAAAVLFSISARAQLIVDATGPHKEPRKTSVSRCGGIGRKLPVQVAVEVHGPARDKDKMVVEFVLTNSGKEDLSIPISPDPDHVEPATEHYSLRRLSVYMTSCASPSEWPCAIAKQQAILPGGAYLYGNEDSATLVTLASGDSIRVRADIALLPVSGTDQKTTAVYVAKAMLDVETVSVARGKTLRECTEDVGSASSPEYTAQALFKSQD